MKSTFTPAIVLVSLFIGVSSCSTENGDGSATGGVSGTGSGGSGGTTGGTSGSGAGTGGEEAGACDCGPLPGPCTPSEQQSPRTPSCPNLGGYRECSCDGTRWLACNLGGLNPTCCEPGEVTSCGDGTWRRCLCNHEWSQECGPSDAGVICDGDAAD